MILSNDTFISYAMKHYDNPSCKTLDEFNEDLSRFKYLKKLLNRYIAGDDTVNFRLIVNHIAILYNVFEYNACTAMLFFKTEREQWSVIAPILEYMNYLPEFISDIGVNTNMIERHSRTVAELKEF
jgi:hypothetical protein